MRDMADARRDRRARAAGRTARRDAGIARVLVSPCTRLVVNQRYEKAGQLVRPRITAPDLRKLSITGLLLVAIASRCSFSPLVVANPTWSMLTFTVTGTPASGPASSPRAIAASMAAASANTSDGLWSTTALILGLNRVEPRQRRLCRLLCRKLFRFDQRREVRGRQTPNIFHCPPIPHQLSVL